MIFDISAIAEARSPPSPRLQVDFLRSERKCYSKSLEMLQCSIRLLLHYLKFKSVTALA